MFFFVFIDRHGAPFTYKALLIMAARCIARDAAEPGWFIVPLNKAPILPGNTGHGQAPFCDDIH
tara:strand:+ start:3566 stop:3757 length:192 start_codon:yes stop_codon:yes gene_type:complete